jgi:hypothetical protein
MVLRVLKEVLWIQTAAMPMLPSHRVDHDLARSLIMNRGQSRPPTPGKAIYEIEGMFNHQVSPHRSYQGVPLLKL